MSWKLSWFSDINALLWLLVTSLVESNMGCLGDVDAGVLLGNPRYETNEFVMIAWLS